MRIIFTSRDRLLGLVDISFEPYESSGKVQESHEAAS